MAITGSCGHFLEADDGISGTQMTFAEIDREGDRCTKTGNYCRKCVVERKNWESFVATAEESKAWFQDGIMPGDFRKHKS